MKPLINYKEHCKLRIISGDSSRHKHEICKLILMLLSKNKYPQAGIYSEVELPNKDIVDVMIDLGQTKIYYEVQQNITNAWLNKIKERDLELDTETQVIKLKELSDNLPKLIKELEEVLI